MEEYKITERGANGGVQKLYRFENDFGVSVVMHDFSYGNEKGLWELAVVKFDGVSEDDFHITYDTYITNDVIGHLSNQDVLNTLGEIKAL